MTANDPRFCVSDRLDGFEDAIALATEIEAGVEPQRIPAQVVYGLYVGAGYTDRTFAEVGEIRSVTVDRPVVETTERIAKIAGRMDGQLRIERTRVSTSDVIIGATAKRFDEPVVTNNEGAVERLDVSVTTY